jgi:hypothetical protein
VYSLSSFSFFFPSQSSLARSAQLLLASVLLIGVGQIGTIPYILKTLNSSIYFYLSSGDRPFLNFTAGQTIVAAELAFYATLLYALILMWRGKTSGWTLVVVTVALVAFLASLPFPLARGHGRQIADIIVLEGTPLKQLTIPLLNLRADPTCIIWEPDPLYLSGYYIYLGSAESKLTLYDPRERRAVRLPSDKAHMIGYPEVTQSEDWAGYCQQRLAQVLSKKATTTTTTTTTTTPS